VDKAGGREGRPYEDQVQRRSGGAVAHFASHALQVRIGTRDGQLVPRVVETKRVRLAAKSRAYLEEQASPRRTRPAVGRPREHLKNRVRSVRDILGHPRVAKVLAALRLVGPTRGQADTDAF